MIECKGHKPKGKCKYGLDNKIGNALRLQLHVHIKLVCHNLLRKHFLQESYSGGMHNLLVELAQACPNIFGVTSRASHLSLTYA